MNIEDKETIRVEMPRKGLTVEFYNGQNQFKVPLMMYVDFEAIALHLRSFSAHSIGLVHLQQIYIQRC